MFGDLLEKAGALGGIGSTLETVQTQLSELNLGEEAQATLTQSFEGIKAALAKMPPDLGALQQHVQPLQQILADNADNPVVQQIQEKVKNLTGGLFG